MQALFLKLNLFLAEITIDPTGKVSSGDGFFNGTSLGSVAGPLINALFTLTGAISVIVLIISGIRYALSAGNSKAVSDAKNGILYAIVGLVVSASAFAIVHFVFKSF